MKIGVISDIEGNDSLLAQVLNELEDCGLIINLGDSVGNKGDTNRVIQLLNHKKIRSILGNHDLEVILNRDVAPSEFMAPMIHESNERYYPDFDVSAESKKFLKTLKLGLKVNFNGLVYGFFHSFWGRYEGDTFYEYVDHKNASELIEKTRCDIVFIGHKHVPAIFTIDENSEVKTIKNMIPIRFKLIRRNKYVINVGSVGASRHRKIKCSYSIMDIDENIVRLVMLE